MPPERSVLEKPPSGGVRPGSTNEGTGLSINYEGIFRGSFSSANRIATTSGTNANNGALLGENIVDPCCRTITLPGPATAMPFGLGAVRSLRVASDGRKETRSRRAP